MPRDMTETPREGQDGASRGTRDSATLLAPRPQTPAPAGCEGGHRLSGDDAHGTTAPLAPETGAPAPCDLATDDARDSARRDTPDRTHTPADDAGRGRAKTSSRESARTQTPVRTDPPATEGRPAKGDARDDAVSSAPDGDHPGDDAGPGGAVRTTRDCADDCSPLPDIFADPLHADLRDLWRLRNRMVEARRRLTLQAKAACRMAAGGDLTEAGRIWTAACAGEGDMAPLVSAFLDAMAPLEARQKDYERALRKLARQLPVAATALQTRGVSEMTLAAVAGELGDLAAYVKPGGMWKRAGLAVIDGGRQRLVPGDAALVHAYSPRRRSALWNVGTALFKAQSHPTPGPWRLHYDRRRVIEDARCATKGHAHARALRHMTKAFLVDLQRQWRAAR